MYVFVTTLARRGVYQLEDAGATKAPPVGVTMGLVDDLFKVAAVMVAVAGGLWLFGGYGLVFMVLVVALA